MGSKFVYLSYLLTEFDRLTGDLLFCSKIPRVCQAVLSSSARDPEAGEKDSVPRESAMDCHHSVHFSRLLSDTSVRYHVV